MEGGKDFSARIRAQFLDGEVGVLRLALIGYGNVGRAFARLLESQRKAFPFRIVAIQTLRHGSAFDQRGLPLDPEFGPRVEPIEEFLDRARPEVVVEITT